FYLEGLVADGNHEGTGAPRREARGARPHRRGGRAPAGAAERDPRGSWEGLRARPRGRSADRSPVVLRERPRRRRAAAVAAARRRVRERARARGRPVPRPAVRMIDTLRLTAEDAIGLVDRGDASPAELHAAYREAIDARDDELHCYLTRVDS